MKIYYMIEDGQVTEMYPVQEGSEEENKIQQDLVDSCDDRTNYGVFKGFECKHIDFTKRICEIALKYIKEKGV